MHRRIVGSILSFVVAASVGSVASGQEPRFERQTIDGDIQIGYGLAIGDVDGDGKQDVLLADKTRVVWYRNGDWAKFVIAENLTERDNVCIAAADVDGDGKVEVAVGAQWNPGETSDASASGAVFYMIRPDDPTERWEAVQLPHDPTTHRMRWYKRLDGVTQLVVLPLHGIGNSDGEGEGVKITAYTMPDDVRGEWATEVIDNEMHMTHNMDVAPGPGGMQWMLFAGKEGIKTIWYGRGWSKDHQGVDGVFYPAGEVRAGAINPQTYAGLYATIEPMHGNTVAAYGVQFGLGQWQITRRVLDESLNAGHGLVVADVLGTGRDQVVAGWRTPNAEGKVGIRLYSPDASRENWTTYTIDDNEMATEDLKAADLDGDGDLDLIAAGRATRNVVIYWNRGGE